MYNAYKRGGYPRPPTLPAGTQYCPPVPGIVSTATGFIDVGNAYKNLPESSRMQQQQCQLMYVNNVPVAVQSGDSNNVPYIEVIPTPASATTLSIQTTVLLAANNPYNPATRFAQYFPPLPPPPPCPVSVPNPGYVAPCIPPSMFRGSLAP